MELIFKNAKWPLKLTCIDRLCDDVDGGGVGDTKKEDLRYKVAKNEMNLLCLCRASDDIKEM